VTGGCAKAWQVAVGTYRLGIMRPPPYFSFRFFASSRLLFSLPFSIVKTFTFQIYIDFSHPFKVLFHSHTSTDFAKAILPTVAYAHSLNSRCPFPLPPISPSTLFYGRRNPPLPFIRIYSSNRISISRRSILDLLPSFSILDRLPRRRAGLRSVLVNARLCIMN